MSKLAAWIDERLGVMPGAPTAFEGFSGNVPELDAGLEDDELDFPDHSSIQGQSFVIEYANSDGEVSLRRITIRKLSRSKDSCLCLKSYCWEKKAARAFRVDRILTLRRISDPSFIDAPSQFFERCMNDGIDGVSAALLRECRPGLRVLLFLARCDGNIHPAELNVMRDYVRRQSKGQFDWAPIAAFLESQHPDPMLARAMLKSSLLNRAQAELLLHAAKRLVEADDIIAPEEVEALDQMLKYSDRQRYLEDVAASIDD